MAGRSPYEVVLSDEQRRELERRAAAYSGPHRDVVRAKAILYAADGMCNAEIARRLDQSRHAVSQWRTPSAQERVQGLKQRPRTGRPQRVCLGAGGRGQALACELPAERGVPLSRWSSAELTREAIGRRIVTTAAGGHNLALADRGRDPAVEGPLVDLPARPQVR